MQVVRAEAWIDTTGVFLRCPDILDAECAPGPDDPSGSAEAEVEPTGRTTWTIALVDPER
ncbi:MAG: hypothetical protein Q8P18_07030 [Pseudomonadota bacterium]|nr:hypothetical protein [Pseudomonadota bacterium]